MRKQGQFYSHVHVSPTPFAFKEAIDKESDRLEGVEVKYCIEWVKYCMERVKYYMERVKYCMDLVNFSDCAAQLASIVKSDGTIW